MIGFAGLSHLGLVSAAAAARRGVHVVAFDPRAATVEAAAAGRPVVFEPGLEEALATAGSRIRWTSDARALADCDVVFVSLDVPTDDDGEADPSPALELAETVAKTVADGASLVLLSQLPVGSTRAFAHRAARIREGQVAVFYQVETLIFGRALARAERPERFIVGGADPAQDLPKAYKAFLSQFACPILVMGYESAELAKIAVNVLLAASVSVTDELADVCERVGADWREIVPALRLDPRIGRDAYLDAGLGIGGTNLGRDLAAVLQLAAVQGTDAGVVQEIRRASGRRRGWLLQRAREAVGTRAGATLAVWGLAYKAGTGSCRGSPALDLVGDLEGTRVVAYDPHAELESPVPPNLARVPTPMAACQGADALAILTSWPEFSAVNLSDVRRALRGDVVLDPFGVLSEAACDQAGLQQIRRGVPRGDAP